MANQKAGRIEQPSNRSNSEQDNTQLTFTCPKSTIETLQEHVEYVRS